MKHNKIHLIPREAVSAQTDGVNLEIIALLTVNENLILLEGSCVIYCITNYSVQHETNTITPGLMT